MPSKKEIWSEFASEINGEYFPNKVFTQPFIISEYNGFRIILTTYVVSTGSSAVTYTTVYTPFVNQNDLKLRVVKKNFFHRLFRSEKNVIHTDDYIFDDRYLIKGNDEESLATLFNNPEIRELVNTQKKIELKIQVNKGYHKGLNKQINKRLGAPINPDESFLLYQCTGVIKDKERLHILHELIQKVLDGFLELDLTSN